MQFVLPLERFRYLLDNMNPDKLDDATNELMEGRYSNAFVLGIKAVVLTDDELNWLHDVTDGHLDT